MGLLQSRLCWAWEWEPSVAFVSKHVIIITIITAK